MLPSPLRGGVHYILSLFVFARNNSPAGRQPAGEFAFGFTGLSLLASH